MHKMQEFLLWSNCNNKCKFCWQCKKADPEVFLNTTEMYDSINKAYDMISQIKNGDDILLVGGEILEPWHKGIGLGIVSLFRKCIASMEKGDIRYLYLNTNLLYSDISLLELILTDFMLSEAWPRLKFTTSYDVYGRFNNPDKEKIFFNNLRYIQNRWPELNIVVNCIITKQLVEYDLEKIFKIQEEYPVVKYINFIPYVPVQDDRSMDVTFRDIVSVLAKLEKKYPGYIQHYIDDFDLNQDKVLYEYRKSEGFVECTSEYLPCHHNENFTKVLNGECYICKLKEIFR